MDREEYIKSGFSKLKSFDSKAHLELVQYLQELKKDEESSYTTLNEKTPPVEALVRANQAKRVSEVLDEIIEFAGPTD